MAIQKTSPTTCYFVKTDEVVQSLLKVMDIMNMNIKLYCLCKHVSHVFQNTLTKLTINQSLYILSTSQTV